MNVDPLDSKLAALGEHLDALGAVVVAFSGGADSAFLAAVAHRRLGAERCRCITAVSPSLADAEADDCARLAAEWGLNWQTVITDEMHDAAYRHNDPDRCYHCKRALMDALDPVIAAINTEQQAQAGAAPATVVLGVNLDDLGDHRPGQRAAAEAGAEFPLVDAGFTKADVRAASRRLGLRTWNKPAAACLASRIPYGTEVSVAVLGRVERAETVLRSLGFEQVRVRHFGDTARIEVERHRLDDLRAHRMAIIEQLRSIGYGEITFDPDGFRSGSLNGPLATASPL